MPSSFVKRVQQYAFHNGLIEKGDKLVVGFSGGPDSTALVSILNELKEKQKLQLAVVHVNYHQRGENSDSDEKFAREFAQKLGLEVFVKKYQEGKSKNMEEDMRNFRYKVFEEICKEKKFDKIAVAHTKDDKAETFLINLIRGSGVEGLTSLKRKRQKIIRPLLGFSKQEIMEYLKGIGQAYRIDESNLDKKFLRNRVREELIPLLEDNYNPNIKSRILDLSEHLASDLEVIDEITNQVYNEKIKWGARGEAEVEVRYFLKLPTALQKRIFRKIIAEIAGDVRNVSSANFFELLKLAKSEKSKKGKFEAGKLVITRDAEKIFFKLK